MLAIVALSACSSQNGYPITYATEPMGASIICSDGSGVASNQGYSPVTLYYPLSEENNQTGVLVTAPCGAAWVSGAKALFSYSWDLKKYPDGVIQTQPRPDIPGYQQDVEFALKVQQLNAQQRQAEAAEYNAYVNNSNTDNSPTWCNQIGSQLFCY